MESLEYQVRIPAWTQEDDARDVWNTYFHEMLWRLYWQENKEDMPNLALKDQSTRHLDSLAITWRQIKINEWQKHATQEEQEAAWRNLIAES